jgi:hypothetical protein
MGIIFRYDFRLRFAFSRSSIEDFAETKSTPNRSKGGEERDASGPAPQRNATREAFSVAHRGKSTAKNLDTQQGRIKGERLKPIRRVMREIVRPDGTILRVEVPVYPPFKLKDRRKTED